MEDITRITLIEDNKVIRESVAKYLSMHEEFELVDTFETVEAFLEEKKQNPKYHTDIFLLDIGLPGMSGIEGIPFIHEVLPDADIMMLTTYEEEDVIVKALCSGACSYLSKKSSLKQIIQAVRIVVKGGSYMSPAIAREIVRYLMGGQISKATILKPRQKEILTRLVDGKSYQNIAEELFISIETVRSHIKRMYRLLQVNNKSEAIALYLKGEIG